MTKVLGMVQKGLGRMVDVLAGLGGRSTMSGLAPRVCATLAALEEAEGLGPEAKGLAKLVHYHQLARRMEDYVGKAGICLVAAALDPQHGHLRFVSEELRDATWALVERWASELPPPMAICCCCC